MSRNINSWFGTVDEFVEPLIDELQPVNNETVRQKYNQLGGRVLAWLNLSYGKDNIDKFIELSDKYGFDKIVEDIYIKNIKTLGRFKNYLDSLS